MQSRTSVVLGIDAGTTSVKTVAFDLSGHIIGVARSTVNLARGKRGEAEVDMELVFEAAMTTISAVVDQIDDATVVAIGITGQGDGAWFIDRQGRPLRPAAVWLDGRATARLDTWLLDGRAAAVARVTGSPLFPGALPLLVDEIFEVEPETAHHLGYHLNCKDYLRFRLTGQVATDPSDSSRTYLDTGTGIYSDELLTRLGHEALRPSLPEVRDPQSIAGVLDESIARMVGLSGGIPVAVGLVDTAAAGVGLGAIGNGEGYVILGTTGFVGVNHASRCEVRVDSSIVLATGRGTQLLESLAPMAGTPNLDWVRHCLGLDDQDWREIERMARAAPPGSGGVVYLPYGSPSGERAPFFDSAASASWLGMSVTTTRGELLRSVYEGLAFSLTECLDALNLRERVMICGGGSESDLFCSILASASGRNVVRQNGPEVGARGVASLALVAAGVEPSLDSAVASLAPDTSAFAPDKTLRTQYDEVYAAFLATRDALRPHWLSLRRIRERQSSTPISPPSNPALLAAP